MKSRQKVKTIWIEMLVLCGITAILPVACCATTAPVSVNVAAGCQVSQSGGGTYAVSMQPGTARSDITGSTFTIRCNDSGGWEMTAVGYGNATEGDTSMHDSTGIYSIATSTTTGASNPSSWAMRFVNPSTGITLDNGFGSFSKIPNEETRVAYVGSGKSLGATISTQYQISVSSTQNTGLYAGAVRYTVVHPATPEPDLTTISNMQDMTSEICSNSSVGDTNNLTDTRDKKIYRVAKLADNKCWMTENLRFGGVDENGNAITMTSNDSNVSRNWSLTSNTYTGAAYTTSTSWAATNTKAEYYPDDSKNSSQYYYGYYYNWYAAVAGSVSGSLKATATQSICPKGWSLPINGNFGTLLYAHGVISTTTATSYTTNGFSIMSTSPIWFIRTGYHYFSGTEVKYRGAAGLYWTRTSASTTNGNFIYFVSNYLNPVGTEAKTNGYSVRCVAL